MNRFVQPHYPAPTGNRKKRKRLKENQRNRCCWSGMDHRHWAPLIAWWSPHRTLEDHHLDTIESGNKCKFIKEMKSRRNQRKLIIYWYIPFVASKVIFTGLSGFITPASPVVTRFWPWHCFLITLCCKYQINTIIGFDVETFEKEPKTVPIISYHK